MGNKMVFLNAGFQFPILLTVAHYGCTWLVIKSMLRLGVYSPAPSQLLTSSGTRRAVFLLISSWSFYNIMSNLSLSKNSVGIYQMVKLLMAPGAVVWDAALYGKHPTLRQAFLLCLAVCGVSLCTVSSFDTGELTSSGLAAAFAAVFLAIVQKGLTSHVIQHSEDKLSPLQLLDSCMPWMCSITVFCAILLEDLAAASRQLQASTCMAIALSSVLGTLANVSSTWVLGLTSPLAHILLGQLKTIAILLGGFIFFDEEPTLRTFLGAVAALTGMTMYAWTKLPRENREMHEGNQACEVDDEETAICKEEPPEIKNIWSVGSPKGSGCRG